MAAVDQAALALLKMAQWASSGDTASPSDESYTIASGWDASYSTQGGRNPEREVFNWLVRGLHAAAKLATLGAPVTWRNDLDFVHPCLCYGSDNNLYVSKKNSGPAGSNAEDPTTDADESSWERLLQDATTQKKGLSQQASPTEVTTGTENTKFVTSKNLKDQIDGATTTVPDATETVKGKAEIATTGAGSEARAGTDHTRIMTPKGVRDAGDARYSLTSHSHDFAATPDATETVKGKAEIATTGAGSEARAGTDHTRIMTPKGVRDAGDSRYSQTSHTHTYPSASETQRGDVELATEAEAKAGTDDARAITPETLRAAGDDRYARKVAGVFELDLAESGKDTRTEGDVWTLIDANATIKAASVGTSWRVATKLSSGTGFVAATLVGWIPDKLVKLSATSYALQGPRATAGSVSVSVSSAGPTLPSHEHNYSDENRHGTIIARTTQGPNSFPALSHSHGASGSVNVYREYRVAFRKNNTDVVEHKLTGTFHVTT